MADEVTVTLVRFARSRAVVAEAGSAKKMSKRPHGPYLVAGKATRVQASNSDLARPDVGEPTASIHTKDVHGARVTPKSSGI